MKRNVLTSALHGSAVYAFDLLLGGWFGKPPYPGGTGNNTNATTTAAIWNAVQSARHTAEAIYNKSAELNERGRGGGRGRRGGGGGGKTLQPEVAVFYDDVSFAHLRLNGIGTNLDFAAPAEWLNDLQQLITQTGTFSIGAMRCNSIISCMPTPRLELYELVNGERISNGVTPLSNESHFLL